MAAPSAKVRNKTAARGAAVTAAAAMSTPRMGPAHGAHNSPIANPTPTFLSGVAAPPAALPAELPINAAPARVTGRATHSAAREESSVTPTMANSTSAMSRPTTFATTSQCAAAVAMSAAAVNAIARPTSIGAISRAKLRPARANTSGMMGRMHGLRIVSTPPRNASSSIVMSHSLFYRTPWNRKGPTHDHVGPPSYHVTACLQREEHLAVLRQRPHVVAHRQLERVAALAHRCHPLRAVRRQ